MSNFLFEWEDYKQKVNEVFLLEVVQMCGVILKCQGGGEYVGLCFGCGGIDCFVVNVGKKKWICCGVMGGGDFIGLVMYVIGLIFV